MRLTHFQRQFLTRRNSFFAGGGDYVYNDPGNVHYNDNKNDDVESHLNEENNKSSSSGGGNGTGLWDSPTEIEAPGDADVKEDIPSDVEQPYIPDPGNGGGSGPGNGSNNGGGSGPGGGSGGLVTNSNKTLFTTTNILIAIGVAIVLYFIIEKSK